jgi:hypothetical protein
MTSGAEQILHDFTNVAPDGSDPIGGLVNLKGTLYGTAFYGGKNGDGIVFKIHRKERFGARPTKI